MIILTNPSTKKLRETETSTIIKLEMEETENLVQVIYKFWSYLLFIPIYSY